MDKKNIFEITMLLTQNLISGVVYAKHRIQRKYIRYAIGTSILGIMAVPPVTLSNATENQFWSQYTAGIFGNSEHYDEYGAALTVGDFNGDGFDDLAIGVPQEDYPGETTNAGGVNVIYGTANGISATGNQFWSQDSPGIIGSPEPYDRYGAVLAAGDFNNDGFDDLAVGVPQEDYPGETTNAGAVSIIYGTSSGLSATGNQLWSQASPGILGSPELYDRYGAVLTAGDFDGDGFDDLAVGIPYEDNQTTNDDGAVNIIYGTSSGLSATGNQLWSQASPGILGSPELYDRYGAVLTAGDFDGDGFDDLAVGIPHEDNQTTNDGVVNIIYGTSGGLSAAGNQLRSQASPGILGSPEPYDQYGDVLTVGDFNDDGFDDLTVGIPYEDYPGETTNAGGVNILY